MHSLKQRIDWKSVKELQLTTNILFYFVRGEIFCYSSIELWHVWVLFGCFLFLTCNLPNTLLDCLQKSFSFFWTWNMHVVLMRRMFMQFLMFWEIHCNLWEMPLLVTLCCSLFSLFTVKWSCLVSTRPQFGKTAQIIFLVDISSPVCFVPFRASRNRPNVLQRFSSSVMQSLEFCCALM